MVSESFLFESVESSSFLAIWAPSGFEWIIVLVVALLLFGKRLPDVARSLGKGIVEFKKGVRGIEDEVENEMHRAELESQNKSDESRKDGD